MKIKKVEIQAFRAYDKVADSTFDFAIGDGQYADFVALYAPNGFGKTSFYDAVEWAITNNIYRFLRRDALNKIYAQDEKQLKFELDNAKSPHYIIRNKHSAADLPGFVKIHFSQPDSITNRNIPKVARIDSTDYSFDEKTTENSSFRDVILSQENIDAFLREDHPESRYIKFMTLFGNKELDQCYSNILYLIKANDLKIVTLEKDLGKQQLELPLNVDHDVLTKVNETVDELIKIGELVPKLLPDGTDKELLDYSNKITDRLLSIQPLMSAQEVLHESVKTQELKIDEYFQLKLRVEQHDNELKSLKSIEQAFKELNQLQNQMLHNNSLIAEQNTVKQAHLDILTILPAFLQLIGDISEKERANSNDKGELAIHETNLNGRKSALVSSKKTIDNFLKEIGELTKKQNGYSELSSTITKLTDEILTITNKANALTSESNTISKELNLAEALIKQKELEVSQVLKNEFSSIEIRKPEIVSLLSSINNHSLEITKIRPLLTQLEDEISRQKNLEEELKKLIVLGSQIVEQSKADHCPLCSTKFEAYDQLSSIIINHPLLSETVQRLFQGKTDAEKELKFHLDEIQKLKDELLKIKNVEVSEARREVQRLSRTKSELEIQINLNSNIQKDKEAELEEIKIQLQGSTFEEYKLEIDNNLLAKQESLRNLQRDNSIREEEIKKVSEAIEKLKQKIATTESSIKGDKSTAAYLKVNKFIADYRLPSISSEIVNNSVRVSETILTDLLKTESNLKEQIEEKNAIVSSYNVNIIQSNISLFQEQRNNANTELLNIIQGFKELFSDFNSDETVDSINEKVRNLKETIAGDLRKNQAKIELLNKAEEFKRNVLPFLTYNKVKATTERLRGDILFYKNTVGQELKREKDKLSSFIDEHIKSFFHEELINKLYQKIDPHPSYKQIKFICDFSGDKPKMNVFVNGEEGIFVIPNLYFSTAQMNILSLSIFLANALNATDDKNDPIDCIFIDDPIQSMDSINILSTIDLFRSIVVNLNKQIILSTHDENFHSLLKKKIPSTSFKSKFIELETFGKIK